MAYELMRGDTDPPVRAPLKDKKGPAPLLGATIEFIMVQARGGKVVVGGAVADAPNASAEDPDAGWVAYAWRADGSDTNTPGVYHQVWKVTFGDGRVQHFPSDEPNEIVIHDAPAAPTPAP